MTVLESDLSPLRVGRITGSRIAKILGLSPYGDRASVMREMVRQALGLPQEFTGNWATAHGQQNEPLALAAYESTRGVMAHSDQLLIVHPRHPFLAVTPDGLIGLDGMVEIKCPPPRARYTHYLDRPDYEAQIRLQLECAGRAWCDLVVWKDGDLSVSRVVHDPQWLPTVLPALEDFLAEYAAILAGAEIPNPYTAPLQNERSDVEWQMAAMDHLELTAELERLKTLVDDSRQRLIDLAEGKSAKGCGVSVTRSERKGTVDYSKVVKERLGEGFDDEAYRKPSTTVWTVRKSETDGL